MSFLPQITKQKRCGTVHQKRIIEENIPSHLKFFHKVQIKGWPPLQLCAAGKTPSENTAAVRPKGQGHSTADEQLPSWADGPFSLGSISMEPFKLASLSMILISEPTRMCLKPLANSSGCSTFEVSLFLSPLIVYPWNCETSNTESKPSIAFQTTSSHRILLFAWLFLVTSRSLISILIQASGLVTKLTPGEAYAGTT